MVVIRPAEGCVDVCARSLYNWFYNCILMSPSLCYVFICNFSSSSVLLHCMFIQICIPVWDSNVLLGGNFFFNHTTTVQLDLDKGWLKVCSAVGRLFPISLWIRIGFKGPPLLATAPGSLLCARCGLKCVLCDITGLCLQCLSCPLWRQWMRVWECFWLHGSQMLYILCMYLFAYQRSCLQNV